MNRYDVAEFGARDVCDAAEARGEPPLEAIDRFRAACMGAIRLDPELHAEYLRGELMAAYERENTPPSYEQDEIDDWLRAPAPDPSRTRELEAQLAAAEKRARGYRAGRLAEPELDDEREIGS